MVNIKYHRLLDQYISDSGLSLREIARQCFERGLEIDHSYISKLRRGVMPPASDKVNRVLATVLGGDPDALILAAYQEKIPPSVLKKLANDVPAFEGVGKVRGC